MNWICHPTEARANSPPSMNKITKTLKVISRVNLCSKPKHRAPSILSVLQRAAQIRNNSLECLCQTRLRGEILIVSLVKTYSLSCSSEKQPDLPSSKSRHQMLITHLERKSSSKGICRRTSWLAIDIWPHLDCLKSSLVSKARSCQFQQRHIWH